MPIDSAALPEETPGLADATGFVHLNTASHLATLRAVSSGAGSPATTGGGVSGGGYSGGGSVGGGGGGNW